MYIIYISIYTHIGMFVCVCTSSVSYTLYCCFCYLLVKKVKPTWKNLRDTFSKRKGEYEKACRSGAAAVAEPSWKW